MGNIWKWAFLSVFLFVAGCGRSDDGPPVVLPPQNVTGDCMSANALLLAGGAPSLVCDAAYFDGSNDYMARGAGFSGAVDGKSGIVSFWYRTEAAGGEYRTIFTDSTGNAYVSARRVTGLETITVAMGNTTPAVSFSRTTSALDNTGAWIHVLMSWDVAASAVHLYVNDVSDSHPGGMVDQTLDYTKSDWGVGAFPPGSYTGINKLSGGLAELYFAPNQYLDFSIETNRRKFITATGKPAPLGTDGAAPTGTAPIMYLHLNDGEAVANFATNRGTGGNLSITGTLDTASTSPSNYGIMMAKYLSQSYSIGAQETFPTGIAMSIDGTKAYVVGSTNKTIYQYSLSTPWNLSTASYASRYMSVASQSGANVGGIAVSDDGNHFYMASYTNDTIYQYYTGTAWEVSAAYYQSKSLTVSAYSTGTTGVTFSADGTKLYALGNTNLQISQWTLSTPWDVSTGTYAGKLKSLSGEIPQASDFSISYDGTRMYITQSSSPVRVCEYIMSTPYDISTAAFNSFMVISTDTAPSGIAVDRVSGKYMYLIGTTNDTMYGYSLN